MADLARVSQLDCDARSSVRGGRWLSSGFRSRRGSNEQPLSPSLDGYSTRSGRQQVGTTPAEARR
jgi:hypothetical protein